MRRGRSLERTANSEASLAFRWFIIGASLPRRDLGGACGARVRTPEEAVPRRGRQPLERSGRETSADAWGLP